MHSYFVYIVSSRSRNLYTGVTNDLERRISQHKQGLVPGFTKHYRIHRTWKDLTEFLFPKFKRTD